MYHTWDARPRHGYVEHEAKRRRETEPAGDLGSGSRAFRPEEQLSCDTEVRVSVTRAMSSRRGVSPLMRVRTRSMDDPVSRVPLDRPKKAFLLPPLCRDCDIRKELVKLYSGLSPYFGRLSGSCDRKWSNENRSTSVVGCVIKSGDNNLVKRAKACAYLLFYGSR